MKKLMGSRLLIGFLPVMLLAAFFAAPEADALLINFTLGNHPDGNQSPPGYGLRLDLASGPHAGVNTFDFTNVNGQIDTTTGQFIVGGVVTHNQTGDTYSLGSLIQLDGAPFTAAQELELLNGINPNIHLTGNTLSLSLNPMSGGTFSPLNWDGFMGPPDFHIQDNHRNHVPLSGYGWLEPVGGGHIASQDWLFTLTPGDDPPFTPLVPEPATMSLFGLGLAGLAWRRARSRA